MSSPALRSEPRPGLPWGWGDGDDSGEGEYGGDESDSDVKGGHQLL